MLLHNQQQARLYLPRVHYGLVPDFRRLFIQDGGVSARGSRQNAPALHAKTQVATREQQFAC